MLQFTVTPEQAGCRLDQLLQTLLPGKTRSAVQKMLEEGLVQADGKPAAKSLKPKAGCLLTVEEPEDCQGRMMRVEADGRVAVRSHMCGERVMWVHPGAEVEVYQMAEEWAVTSLGFIRSKYLTEDD